MRIAIVDGYSSGRALGRELHTRGADCFHLRSRPHLPEALTASFQPRLYEKDFGYTGDFLTLVAVLRGIRVRQVVAGAETGVLLAEALADALGLPGNSRLTGPYRRSKAQMSAALLRAGLAAPLDRVVESPAEGVGWYEEMGFAEVVVKPVDSSGSDNVRFCRGASEVARACRAILSAPNLFGDTNRGALVQERLTGREFYVNTVSDRGVHTIAESWQYTKHAVDGRLPVYDQGEPTGPADPEASALHTYVRAALTALGVEYGAAHSEVMLTARGPVLIETGARLGGAVQPAVTARHTGSSHAGLLADLLTGRGVPLGGGPVLHWPRAVRHVSLINERGGIVPSDDWQHLVRSLPTADTLVPLVRTGQRLVRTTDPAGSPGYVQLVADDRAELERDCATLRRWESDGLYTRRISRAEVRSFQIKAVQMRPVAAV